jgi:peptidoglycan/LPS O-acetylase OafA/YrhL
VGVLLWPLAPSNQLAFCLKNQQAFFGPVFWGSLLTFSFNWYRGFIAVVHDYGLHWDILWSLSIEEQFYFFYPLSLALLVKLRNLYRFLLVFIVLGPLMNAIGVLIFPNVNYWFMNSFSQFDLIAMGCLLYLVTERYKNLLRNNKNACFFFCLAGGFMVLRTFLNIPTELDYARRIFGYFSVGAGTFLFLLGGLHLKVFDSKYLAPLALPGKMSYGGYLLHPAILYFAWPWLSGKGEWVVFPMFCAIALGVTWLSYRFYELPANQWVRRRLNK